MKDFISQQRSLYVKSIKSYVHSYLFQFCQLNHKNQKHSTLQNKILALFLLVPCRFITIELFIHLIFSKPIIASFAKENQQTMKYENS
jgi:hypothetical protein